MMILPRVELPVLLNIVIKYTFEHLKPSPYFDAKNDCILPDFQTK